MVADLGEQELLSGQDSQSVSLKASSEKKREIKGGLPYSTSPVTFKKTLDSIIVAERPERFSSDFMATVLKVSGGSARPIPPMLKKMNFITSDGIPTDLYSKFKSDSARGQSALDGLKAAYGELFKRNEFVYRAEESGVKDIIVEITGLKKADPIVSLIYRSFDAIRQFTDRAATPAGDSSVVTARQDDPDDRPAVADVTTGHRRGGLGLSYHINVILPETENIAVFNAIFRSLRENLL